MKTSVRFLSLLLAISMLAGMTFTVFAGTAETKANDEALQLLVDLGIFGGYEDGSLQPDRLVERDEMAKIIYVLSTTFNEAGEGTDIFTDLAADNWAAGYISWAYNMGIIGGYGNGKFGPDDNVTYDQALKMVCGALGYNDWNSALWPTDVRTKALIDLKLGANIEGVKGEDTVTRAQIAQIAYNALFASMKTADPSTAKTLAEDIWGFKSVTKRIVAAGYFGDVSLSEDADIYVDGIGEFTLEELGLESYAGNIADLYRADISFFYNANSVANTSDITTDDIIAASIVTNVKNDVEVTYDDKKDKIYIGGKEADENPRLLSCTSGIVSDTSLTSTDVPSVNETYVAVAYDCDHDGKYEAVSIDYPKALKVISTTSRTTTFEVYNTSPAETLSKSADAMVNADGLAEDDVVVAVERFGKLEILQKLTPVTAKATAFGNGKITLDKAGTLEVNNKVFKDNPIHTIDVTVLDFGPDGKTRLYDYYIYDGKVLGASLTTTTVDTTFALLACINAPEAAEETESIFINGDNCTAVVYIGGKKLEVSVNMNDTIDALSMASNQTEILETYGKKFTNDGVNFLPYGTSGKYEAYNYTLVTYTVDGNGNYTFSTADPADYIVYDNATITYNSALGLYEIKDAGGNTLKNKVFLDKSAIFYYSYKNEGTGHHTYIANYTAKNLPSNLDKVDVISKVYLTESDIDGFYTLHTAVIDKDGMVVKAQSNADYKTDARQIYYCYQASSQVLSADGSSFNYTYFLRSIYNGSDLAEKTNTELTAAQGATNASVGNLYAWDEATKNYIRINKSTLASKGITSINSYTLCDVVNGNVIYTEPDSKFADGVKIDEKVDIWALTSNSTTYTKLAVADLYTIFKCAGEAGEQAEIIIGTYINDSGEEVVSSLIIHRYYYNNNGTVSSNNNTLISNFNS